MVELELSKEERRQMLNIAKGLGKEIEKHKSIDKETAKEMILLTLEETAKELISRRNKK